MGKNSNKVRLELRYDECNNPSDNSSKRNSRNPFEDNDNNNVNLSQTTESVYPEFDLRMK